MWAETGTEEFPLLLKEVPTERMEHLIHEAGSQHGQDGLCPQRGRECCYSSKQAKNQG